MYTCDVGLHNESENEALADGSISPNILGIHLDKTPGWKMLF